MLHLFRSKRNSLRWVLWLVIFTLGAGMVLLFVNPPSGPAGTFGNEVARVCGNSIGIVEFQRQYRQLLEQYEQQFNLSQQNPGLLKQLRLGDQALNQIIGEYAVSCEAERIGLATTPSEVSARIISYPVFREASTGRFIGVDRYRQILEANNLSVGEFEEAIRRQILREKLTQVLTDGIKANPAAIREEFASRTQQVKVRYVYFDSELDGQAEVDEEALKDFYEANTDRYTLSEQRKIRYLSVPFDPSAVELSESQVQARVADLPEELYVRASHILFRLGPDEDDAEARRRARALRAQIMGGADFAEMARQHSDDATAALGGDLGFFKRGDMVPEFQKVAFSLKENEVSRPVKTPFGIHLIKATAVTTDVNQSRRRAAEFELRKEEAERLAESRAAELKAELDAGADLQQVASREGLPSGETEFFGVANSIAELPVRGDFNQQVFALQEGEATEPYRAPDSYLIGVFADSQAARLQPFDQVRQQVLQAYRQERGSTLAEKQAEDFFKEALQAGSLEEAARQRRLQVHQTGFFKKGSTVDDILKFSPVLHDRAQIMNPGEVSPPFVVSGKRIVFELVEKTPIDAEAFEKEKEQIAETLQQQQRNAFLSSYIESVLEDLRSDNRIVINQELLDALTS